LHEADNGTTGVRIHRDPEDPEHILFAVRYWYTYDPLNPGSTGIERKTVYLPNEIRKYRRKSTASANGDTSLMWEMVQDEGDSAWPIPWQDRRGNPLGIPIIEFSNPGGSEIAQIIGLQDVLNKGWLDLIAAADTEGFPLIAIEYSTDGTFSSSVQDDDDLQGGDEFRISPGRAIEVDDAKVHRIEGGNLDQLLNFIWAVTAAIAGVSRTPQYYLRPIGGADVPSGEALKQLESGLVKRAEERQLVFGQSWEDAFALAYRVADMFGSRLPDAELHIETLWDDPEVRNELSETQRAEGWKRLEVPNEAIWQLLGFTQDQIAAWGDTQRLAQAQQVATIAAALRTQGQNGASNERTDQANQG
jgi:hypothetical protein